MKMLLLIPLALLCLCAFAAVLDGDTIKLTPDEAAKCAAAGGCVVVPLELLERILGAVQTCRRGVSI